MIAKLLIGTGNPSKLKHYQRYFADILIELIMPRDLGIAEQPRETGQTLEDNAVLKAKYYAERSGLPTLADDAGFEIPALNNFPGVMARRFAGHNMTDEEVISGILDRMKHLKGDERRARMRVVCALALAPNRIFTASGVIEGHVPEAPYEKREPHLPYRSLLFVDKLNVWFDELTADGLEDKVGYRKAAVEQLKKFL